MPGLLQHHHGGAVGGGVGVGGGDDAVVAAPDHRHRHRPGVEAAPRLGPLPALGEQPGGQRAEQLAHAVEALVAQDPVHHRAGDE